MLLTTMNNHALIFCCEIFMSGKLNVARYPWQHHHRHLLISPACFTCLALELQTFCQAIVEIHAPHHPVVTSQNVLLLKH